MSKAQKIVRNLVLAGVAVAALAGSPATSSPSFDGLWSVVIITDQGTCDRAYRYPIRISRGTLLNEGASPVTINGRVAGTGTVSVVVSRGSQNATGSGRLRGNIGTGTWHGGDCSGTWQAERRGA